ncbi:DUF6683 family protein [Yoonia sp. 2307UL14-13]|uniref:DUF6683 family protein n=1 Tax=Yoonia sp. 2307UL14-13 TaxID=3126506 RepID=UPI0030AE9326
MPIRAFIIVCLVAFAGKAAAQFTDIGGGFVSAGVHGAIMNGITDNAQSGGTAAPATAPRDTLVFSPSIERRRQNYANFIQKSRRVDPTGAAQLESDLSRTDILAFADGPLRNLGFDPNNVADAYSAWLMTAWLAAQGRTDTPSMRTMNAVRDQVTEVFLTLPEVTAASDAVKQETAEAYYLQALMIDVTVDAAKSDPAYMEQLKAAVRQGAIASGVNLDMFNLTENGLVLR